MNTTIQFKLGKNISFKYEGEWFTGHFFYFFLRKKVCVVKHSSQLEYFSVKKTWLNQLRKIWQGVSYYIEHNRSEIMLRSSLTRSWKVSYEHHLLEYHESKDITKVHLNSELIGQIQYNYFKTTASADLCFNSDCSFAKDPQLRSEIELLVIKGFVLIRTAEFVYSADTSLLMND